MTLLNPNQIEETETEQNPYKDMLTPKEILAKYPTAKKLTCRRGKPLTFRKVGFLVNMKLIEGYSFPYGGCCVKESSFVEFIERQGIQLTESPKPF